MQCKSLSYPCITTPVKTFFSFEIFDDILSFGQEYFHERKIKCLMFTFERVIGTWHHFLKMYKQMPTFDTLGLTLFIQILTILSILRQPLQYSGIFHSNLPLHTPCSMLMLIWNFNGILGYFFKVQRDILDDEYLLTFGRHI